MNNAVISLSKQLANQAGHFFLTRKICFGFGLADLIVKLVRGVVLWKYYVCDNGLIVSCFIG